MPNGVLEKVLRVYLVNFTVNFKGELIIRGKGISKIYLSVLEICPDNNLSGSIQEHVGCPESQKQCSTLQQQGCSLTVLPRSWYSGSCVPRQNLPTFDYSAINAGFSLVFLGCEFYQGDLDQDVRIKQSTLLLGIPIGQSIHSVVKLVYSDFINGEKELS